MRRDFGERVIYNLINVREEGIMMFTLNVLHAAQQEERNIKFVKIQLKDYLSGNYTLSAILQWREVKKILGEVLLEESWFNTSDEYTIYVTRDIYPLWESIFKGREFVAVSANELESRLRTNLFPENSQIKQKQQQEKYEVCERGLQEHYAFFNNKKIELCQLCEKLNKANVLNEKFAFYPLIASEHIPHLRLGQKVDEIKADTSISLLQDYGLDVSKCSEGDAFIVVVKGVRNEQKFQAIVDDCADQKGCCVMM